MEAHARSLLLLLSVALLGGLAGGCTEPPRALDEFSLEGVSGACDGVFTGWCIDDDRFVVHSAAHSEPRLLPNGEEDPDSAPGTAISLRHPDGREITLRINLPREAPLWVGAGQRLLLRFQRHIKPYANRVVLSLEDLDGGVIYRYYRVDGMRSLVDSSGGPLDIALVGLGPEVKDGTCPLERLALRFTGRAGRRIELAPGEWGDLEGGGAEYRIRVFAASRDNGTGCGGPYLGEVIYAMLKIR